MDTPVSEPDAAGSGRPVRVGLIGPDGATRQALRDGLTAHGLEVAVETVLGAYLARGVCEPVDVLLVDLHAANDADLDSLDDLLDRADLPPVLFNETAAEGVQRVWMRRLAEKVTDLGGTASERTEPATGPRTALPSAPVVWVLGASFGGPEAVKRFLDAISDIPQATFFLAQHIGNGFADVLAAQLNRSTRFPVSAMRSGLVPRPANLYVAPVDARVRIDPRGTLELETDGSHERVHRPSIDQLMMEVARVHGPHAGAIIFSGMGKDGAAGAHAIAANGGEVWAQDADSCTVSNMPEAAAATGTVTRRGTPEELAGALVQYLQGARRGAC